MSKKVIVIGIDGADWALTKKWMEQNELPNLQKISKEGIFNKLQSTIPPLSPSAWTSIFTGKKPSDHGIYGFLKQKENDYFYRPMSSKDRTAEPIWITLSKQGLRSVIANIPFTYPPDIIDGVMITGLGSPGIDSNFVYPQKYKKWILNRYPEFNVDLTERILETKTDIDDFESNIVKIEEIQLKVFLDLLDKEEWDFSVMVFRSLDVIQHYKFNDKNLLLKHYKRVDSYLGEIISKHPNSLYLICSDHGFRSIHKKFYVNNWLKKNGYLKFVHDSNLLLKIGIDAEKIRDIFLKYKFEKLLHKIENSKFTDKYLKVIPSSSHQYLFNVNWKESKAFYYRASSGLIKINLKDRELEGFISEKEKNKMINEIVNKLKNVKDPNTNMNIFEQVYSKEELDMASKDMPEILILPNEGYEIMDYNENGNTFEERNDRPGDHGLNGVILTNFPLEFDDIEHVWDINPTIKKLFDV